MVELLNEKGLEAAEDAWNATDMGLRWKLSDAIRAYLSALPAPDGELVERLNGITVSAVRANLDVLGTRPVEAANATIREAVSTILSLKQANEALMQERTSLIDTKREQIERLTRERDEARLLFEQGQAMDEHAIETGLVVSCIDHAIMRGRAEAAEAQVRVLERKQELYEATVSFVRRWAIEKEGNGTSAEERLSVIAHHPGIALSGRAALSDGGRQ